MNLNKGSKDIALYVVSFVECLILRESAQTHSLAFIMCMIGRYVPGGLIFNFQPDTIDVGL